MVLVRTGFPRSGCSVGFALGLSLALVAASNTQLQGQSTPQVPTPIVEPQATTPPPNANAAAPNAKTQANDSANQTSGDSTLVRLGPGDLIEVSVYNVPELATKARVGSSGDVYLPLIDYVHVADMSVEEAQALIEKRLGDGGFVRNPHVTIFVDESASQGVTILGEVTKPGVYPSLGDHKLFDLVSQAGGFTATASRKVSVIHRNQQQPVQVTLARNLADDLTGNIDILPGDTITVPRAPIVYVVGDVGRPSGVLIDNGTLTVMQALALAGWSNKTAKMGGVKIIRKGPAGITQTPVPLKDIIRAKVPDVTLQADDILFVPLSNAKVIAARSVEAAMSAATAVSVYTVRP